MQYLQGAYEEISFRQGSLKIDVCVWSILNVRCQVLLNIRDPEKWLQSVLDTVYVWEDVRVR
jgi:hypothetical protein